MCFAEEASASTQLDLKHHFIGYFAIAITVIAYAIAMTENLHQMKKAKPMVLESAIIWFNITILSNVFFDMPAIAGMIFGLGILQSFAYYLTKSENKYAKINYFLTEHGKQSFFNSKKGFDVFKCIAGVDWDTLLFFYGAMMIVGALSFLGYLDAMAHYLFTEINPTLANIFIGLSSSSIDNGTLMFAVLNMHPNLPTGQWLLLTLTLGVGGSLLAIGSAPALHVLGLMKGHLKEGEGYTFTLHLRWMPVILLGFFASIGALFLISGGTY